MTKQKAQETNLSDLFIAPYERVDVSHDDVQKFVNATKYELRKRWSTEKGCEIIKKLRESNFERPAIEESVGTLYDQLDLRGINIKGNDLSYKNLQNIDFFCANLRSVQFCGADLTNSHFSEANIKNADFSFAKMCNAFVDNAIYNLKTTFTGVDIRHVNFNLAELLRDQARDQQRIAHLKHRHPILAFILRITCFYGQSLSLWLTWVVATILIFSVLFYFFPILVPVCDFIDAIYFSVVTFTTVGYGDITPVSSIGKIVVMVEVILGYLMGGLLISILIRRLIGS